MHSRLDFIRLRALLVKEWLQIIRDPSSIALAFFIPIVMLLLFGYGISLDPKELPVAFVMDKPDPTGSTLLARFLHSDYFDPVPMTSWPEARQLLLDRKVDAVIRLQTDFTRRLMTGGQAPVQLIVNGVDSNRALQILGYVTMTWRGWLAEVQKTLPGAQAQTPVGLVDLQQRIWFNEAIRSENFLVPGLMAIIMTLIGTLLTAMVMAREWERGTMEALLVTPVSRLEIVLGKLIPYFLLGMGGLVLCIVMAVFLFHVPFRGSLVLLLVLGGVFMVGTLGLGLFISSTAKNQFVAGQIALLAAFLPSFFLSGFIFELASTPLFIQVLSYIVPAKYFVNIVQTLFLAGNVTSVLLPNLAGMAVLALVFMTLAFRKTRKSLE
ncbi:ABC-2 type transporter [Pseudodesulfovibrio mercurii]|uniref:ABC-2 type transporter n=1 Tax=Pseudodesulfovibrio mercurii TaxID=641491 RepID=F0JCW1_9BACT|nr:ABC transporter permease [Pseudodesulfovibrio mercurii]EGB13289.1 ABC-2 type transporter [Pseudodesulfovibrio mercurii]